MAAAADCRGRRLFAVACDVLSQRVRAEAGKMTAAALGGPSAAAALAPTMLLMPGADVAGEEPAEAKAEAEAHAQLTIMYGGRVVVFDDVPEDQAAELVRVATAMPQHVPEDRAAELMLRVAPMPQNAPDGGLVDMRVARKASLRRFMEKRRDRHAARAPYGGAPSQESSLPASNSKKVKPAQEVDTAGSWLGLGLPGGCRR